MYFYFRWRFAGEPFDFNGGTHEGDFLLASLWARRASLSAFSRASSFSNWSFDSSSLLRFLSSPEPRLGRSGCGVIGSEEANRSLAIFYFSFTF